MNVAIILTPNGLANRWITGSSEYVASAGASSACVYMILSITMLLVDVWNGFFEALKVPALSSNDFWLVNCRAATPEMADSRDNILIAN